MLTRCTETRGPRATVVQGDGHVLPDTRIIVTVSSTSVQRAITVLTSSGTEELPYEEWNLIVNQKLHHVMSHTTFYSQQREKNSRPGLEASGFPSAAPAASPLARPLPKTDRCLVLFLSDCSSSTSDSPTSNGRLSLNISNVKRKLGTVNRCCEF